ncbi:MAG TPA: AAA family ATPase [Candidatus Saccharimonadales bacterium]|nr:AAA family ATPase [Candidatus Saccharimonadales bacterium]
MRSLHLTRPRAIMMVGVPGSGKSFFASQFSHTFSTPFIDSETINAITGDRVASGRIIALLLIEICKTNQTFILEGNSETKTLRTEFAEFAKRHGYDPLFIWVQADPIISRQRSAKKGRNKESYESTLRRFEAPADAEKALVVSGRHTYATQVRMVLNHIGNDNRPPIAHERQPSPVVPVRKRL